MSTNTDLNKSGPTEAVPPAATPHNSHNVLDTIETAALDELQHEAALRDSALRVPR